MQALIRLSLAGLAFLAGLSVGFAAWAEYAVPDIGIRFPDRLASFELWKGEKYPEAALGHGVEYRAPGFAGSVYVYRGGNPSVPDGVTNNLVRSEFAKARGDIAALAKMKGDPEPELVGEQPVKAAGIEFLTATYRMQRNDRAVTSLVGMTGARGHFIKLRVSVPSAGTVLVTDEIYAFIAAVARLLAKSSSVIDGFPVMATTSAR